MTIIPKWWPYSLTQVPDFSKEKQVTVTKDNVRWEDSSMIQEVKAHTHSTSVSKKTASSASDRVQSQGRLSLQDWLWVQTCESHSDSL